MDKLNAVPTSPSARSGRGERILIINPGSASTKITVYEDEVPLLVRNIRHTVEELSALPQMIDQFRFRKSFTLRELETNDIPFQFDVVIGHGGLMKPISGGVYEVNEVVKRNTLHAMRTHACNLDGLIADELVATLPGCRAFTANPGVMDELGEVARITGSPLIPRITIWHALNQKAIAHRYTAERGTRYEDLGLIVCHLGGGISVAVHRRGRAVDVNSMLDGGGPFSPKRARILPVGQLIDLCFSGKFTRDELKKRTSGCAELTIHLETTNIPAVIQSIEADGDHARLVLDTMIYNMAKSTGAASTVLCERVNAILLTGGTAYSGYIISHLGERISFLVPVFVCPGEGEMEALALNALGALRGELPIRVYQ